MKAVVFGAGKIARGFIGQLLYLSGAKTTFIDVNQALVDTLNRDKTYHVHILGDATFDSDVCNFEALCLSEREAIHHVLKEADIIFVSVGGQNLKDVGKVIAHVYHRYGMPEKVCNYVTCENWKDAALTLYEGISTNLDKEEKSVFDLFIGVSEAVVMRSATQPSDACIQRDPTGVWVQNYWYLPIDAKRFKGALPPIKDCELMKHFGNFLTQKMYTNNTSNALIAYNGYLLGYDILAEAANSEKIAKLLDKLYIEINDTLIKELGVERNKQEEFARKARLKYTDRTIIDRVIRHAKDPIRKLGPQDRLIAPARMALKHGIYPMMMIDTIAKALFFDEISDEAAQTLKLMREQKGIPYVLQNVCKLDQDEVLYKEVLKAVDCLYTKGWVKKNG